MKNDNFFNNIDNNINNNNNKYIYNDIQNSKFL